ncbi:type II toxin-antitoxin system PemK/MazF family toxin [Peribacillus simplex]|uniref:type II toxin-antitoxin system PemK/MazF family toxin n=1 Tax=Peribacillus TaxID=2675229 RepID=UPI00315CF007
MKPGEIYDIYFPYKEKAGGKRRPALILDVNNGRALAVAIKITSSPPSSRFPNRVPITRWLYAKLDNFSYAEIDSQTTIAILSPPPLRGRMHPDDFSNVVQEYAKLRTK